MAAGMYYVSVWDRDQHSTSLYDDSVTMSYLVKLDATACGASTLTSSPASPQPAGTLVTLTAAAQYCAGTPQFRFNLLPAGGSWSMLRAYSTVSTFNWDTSAVPMGVYYLQIWARNSGSAAPYETAAVLTFVVATDHQPCSTATLSANQPSPQTAGQTITLTAGAGGCSSPEFQFWILSPGGSWSSVQAYSPSNTYTWNTAGRTPGTYGLIVWARRLGSSQGWEASAGFPFTIQ